MSCTSGIEPLQLTFQDITLTNDGKAQSHGIAVQIGSPPQTFSLTPTTFMNNTFVNNIATCGSESNSTCVSIIGGGYDASASSTFASSTYDAWNGSAESTEDAFIALAGSIYFNDILSVAAQKLSGFPLLIQANSNLNFYAGLGLGKNSSFISQLFDDRVVPSRSWSLYPGMYSDTGAGSLIVGGYADRFYTGELQRRNVADAENGPSWQVASMEYQTDGSTVDLLPDGTAGQFTAYVDPYYPSMMVPDETFYRWGNATNGVSSNGTLQLHGYPLDNLPPGNVTITLTNGLKTTIPNEALFSPPAYDNGILSTMGGDTENTAYSAFMPLSSMYGQAAASINSYASFGIPYAAMVYIIMDWEQKQLSIANANQAAQISGDAIAICGSSSKDGESSNTGAIAGGVVGGVVVLALIAVLAWFLRRRKQKKATVGAGNTSPTDDKHGLMGSELPQYSAVDRHSPNDKKNAIDSPAQEMPAPHVATEMPGTQHALPQEMPTNNGKTFRSELPA
ncbi:hypothetical protein PMZ80_005854 [Knufia obscura]|uniref:Peptidase A1 domain-containing protein n=2 Tax=Knufia TaxID=430999 RepID=A0AAN8FAE5_9EURO|nr:hypothetical protein PMZ80_005854 [Knufia obscura]KAK5954521.1 hypothetical protein OHC33_004243 [Knufia fluminis]